LAGIRFGEKTSGAFDITVQPLVGAWGFIDGRHRVPDSAELAGLVRRVDYRRVFVNGDTVALGDGVMLDLGGIATGMAVDRAVEVLQFAGAEQGLIDAGGDIRVFGNRTWRIGVQAPRGAGVVRVLRLRDRAVSTSGDYQKFFEQGGVRYCHVLNPRTGKPVQGVASVTVIAPTSLDADAFSTAVMALGPDSGLALLAAETSLAAVAAYELDGRLVWREAGRVP
ncbi:MAG: FAD:protein FMN transferase, partial [candidate division WOR-3 bacterium]